MVEACIGIYKLTCVPTGKVYVGSAMNCSSRTNTHRNKLLSGKHINVFLQAAWDKHGAENFAFSIIEKCSKLQLKEREQFWINHYNSGSNKHGFNLAPAVRQDMPAEQLSLIMKGYWSGLSDDERNDRHAYKRSDKGRARLRQNAIDQWADPEFCKSMPAKVSATMKEYCKDPYVIAHRTAISRAYWASEAAKKKMAQRMLRQWQEVPTEERAKRLSGLGPRESTRYLTIKGVIKTLKEWAVESGMPYGLLLTRLTNGCVLDGMFLPSYKHKPVKGFMRKWFRPRLNPNS